MKTIALLGVGLMGGSIGLALRSRNVPLRIQAYARRQQTRDETLALGIADAVYADPAEAVRDADLVILCVPVCAIPVLLKAVLPGLKQDAVVTDVGSTKAWLSSSCAEVLKDSTATFVGSHPMCGSEKTGLNVADANLYQGATCIVTADPATRDVVWQVSHFWTRLGARVVEMPADQHDQLAAVTSHVPHLAASALVLACGESSDSLKSLIGPGFRDSTRIAAGSPVLWRDIIETNSSAVSEGLRKLQAELSEVVNAVENRDYDSVEHFLQRGVDLRRQLCTDSPPPPQANGVITIDGPSASGKSTVARSIAKRMNSLYVDSGALYRGMTWMVLQSGAAPGSEAEVLREMEQADWDFPIKAGAVTFTINGQDPGEAIRGEAVRENVSYVARIPEVRRFIVDQIRSMRALGPLVVEGRDIGSVVFPESPHKFYLDADPVERARRRNQELLATERDTCVETVQESLRKRDHLDSTRETAPLQIAEGAHVVDTTELTLDQVVDQIIDQIRAG
jgi:cytidylate kinase